ncbi:MAG TPA: hypothetical protein VIY27_08825 [Myxococcota bacterium]
MDRDLERLHERIEQLSREVAELRSRLDGFAEGEGVAGATRLGVPGDGVPAAKQRAARDAEIAKLPTRTVALVGRTLIVLGGAYLFRAISDAGVVPAQVGAIVALLYAAWWLVQADRSARAGQPLSATFHGVAAALVAYPLIWETTTRFQLFSAPAAAIALVGFAALGLAVARRRELRELAWIIVLFDLVAALALMVGTRDFLPFSVALLLAAAGVEILAVGDRWLPLRWPAALGIDLAVVLIISLALRPESAPKLQAALPVGGVIAVVLALPTLYLVSIGTRTLLRQRQISVFGVTQAAVALLLGFGGAVRVIAHEGMNPIAIGIVSLLLGAGCYVVAFTSIDRRLGRCRNFYTYTTFAGLMILGGSSLVLAHFWLALLWPALALAAVGLGGRFDRITLEFHGALYAFSGALAAGLVTFAADGLLADPAGDRQPLAPLAIGVTAAIAACYGLLVTARRSLAREWYELLPRAILGALVVWSVTGMVASWLGRPAIAASAYGSQAAFVTSSRTGIIALAAVALAWAGRRWSLQELLWLVYPVLVAGGLKLLWQDFHLDEPVALCVALAAYGSALILTPRLMKKEA